MSALTPAERQSLNFCPACDGEVHSHNDLGRTIRPEICERTVPEARLAAVERIVADRERALVERVEVVLPDLMQVAVLLARYAQDDCECDHFTNGRAVTLKAAIDRLRAALTPSADTEVECICPHTDPSTWLSAASCGYGSGYEPGSTQEWNPDCPVHPGSAPTTARGDGQ